MFTKKKIVALLIVLLSTLLCTSYYRAKTKSIPILMYHSVKENYPQESSSLYVTTEVFEKQLSEIIAKGYTCVNYYQVLDYMNGTGTLPEKPIIITFDDGYLDNYVNVFPILMRYNAKATIFVVTDALNDEDIAYDESQIQFMTWKQAIEMQNSGLVNIESHTKNHLNLNNLTEKEVNDQLRLSKEKIKAKMGKDTYIISVPFGAGNWKVVEQCRANGYKMTTLVYPNTINKINSYTYKVSRLSMTNDTEISKILP